MIVEVLTSSLAGRRFAFTARDLRRGVLLGRAPDCHLRFDINRDVKVSAHHALILETRDGIFVRDQGSSNGLYVNHQRATPEGLRAYDGAEINLGTEGAVLKLLIPDHPAPQGEPAAPANPTVREKPGGLTRFVEQVGDQVGAGEKTKRMIKEVADRLEARAAKRRARLVALIATLFVLLLLGGAAGVAYYFYNEKEQARRQQEADEQSRARDNERDLRDEAREQALADMRTQLAVMEASLSKEAKRLREEQGRRFEELKREVDDSTVERVREVADAQLRDLREASEAQKRQLEELSRRPGTPRFQELAETYKPSVFLIYVQYPLLDQEGKAVGVESGTGTGWLAGVTDDAAWVITNKHVIKPFLFKAELAIAHAIRDVRPAPITDWVVAAWQPDAKIRNFVGDTELSLSEAWAQTPSGKGGKGGVEAAGFAEDEWQAFGDEYERHLVRSGFRTDLPAAMIERIKQAGIHKMDTTRDLAVLRLERRRGVVLGKPIPIASDAEIRKLKVVDPVMALGFPLGLSVIKGTTVTASPATGEVRNIQLEVGVIDTSAPILPGNSGGPLIDAQGRVVGVITRRFEATMGTAISAEYARLLLLDMIK